MRWKACAWMQAVVGALWLIHGRPAAADLTTSITFTAYNDAVPGTGTHPNTTTYSANAAVTSGRLKDIFTGEYTEVVLSTSDVGVTYQNNSAGPAAGTDAFNIFDGYVRFASGTGNSLEVVDDDTYTYQFTNLNPDYTYEFAGTAIRGDDSYTDRWTLITLVGADSFTSAHSTGLGVVTENLENNQVAIWTGANHNPDQGFVAQWKDIDPGDDAEFQVVSMQYTGPTPGVGSGTADGSKGYAVNGIRLIEVIPEPATLALLGLGATALSRLRPARCSSTVSPGRHPRNLKEI